jgi:hypothetical protein
MLHDEAVLQQTNHFHQQLLHFCNSKTHKCYTIKQTNN